MESRLGFVGVGVSTAAGRAAALDVEVCTAPARASVVQRVSMKNDVSSASGSQDKDEQKAPKRGTSIGKICVIGLSHHTATVEVREKLAVAEAEWQKVANELTDLPNVSEAAVLSTCNRFEVYFVTDDVFHGIRSVSDYLAKRAQLSVFELRNFLFMLNEQQCVWHMLRVSAGLDSLVVGEGQILSQVRRCYELASDAEGAAGKILTKFLNTAVASGKRVRSETDIARGAVSISSAAVELAEMNCVFDLGLHLREAKICIIGAGNMSRLLVQHLVSREVSSITIVNRSLDRAEELARMFPDAPIQLRTLPKMLECIGEADITFTSTGARDPILFKENLGPVLEGQKKMLVDISVPLNIAGDVNDIDGCQAYNVDDLKAVVAKNQSKRKRLVVEAENLLKEELKSFHNWHQSIGAVPYITRLQTRAEAIRQEEMDKCASKLSNLSKAELKAVEKLTKGIVNKMLHGPMSHVKELQDVEERKLVLKNLEAMFKLGTA